MESTNRSFYISLLQAQKAAKAVLKRGHEALNGFDYAKADDVITEGREALNSAGLILDRTETIIDQSRSLICMKFNLIHAESGTVKEYVKEQFYSDSMLSGKVYGQLAAETLGLSYLYRDILSLSRKSNDCTLDINLSATNAQSQTPPSPPVYHEVEKPRSTYSYWKEQQLNADNSGLYLRFSDVPIAIDIDSYNETVFELDKAIRRASDEYLEKSDCEGFLIRQTYLSAEELTYLLSLLAIRRNRKLVDEPIAFKER